MNLNLASLVENSARYLPGAVALIHDDSRMTYAELSREVRRLARYLQNLGVGQGDRVALLLPNRMSFTIAYFGVLHAGAVAVPISFLSVGREIAYSLDDSGAVALIAWDAYSPQATEGFESTSSCRELLILDESSGPATIVNRAAARDDLDCELFPSRPQDPAVILYTSGTTGQPKGAVLSHFNLYSNAQYSGERLFWKPGGAIEPIGPGHVTLAALPLFHSFGQTCNQNATLLGGGTLTYVERFDPAHALEVMERDHVTLFSGVPTMYFQLLRCPDRSRRDLSSLRYCMSGGAAMPVDVMKEFDETFGVSILEGYGLSETSPVATFNVLFRPKKAGSIGESIVGVDVRVFDSEDRELPVGEVGELVIRGPNIMLGYHGRPRATATAMRGGWFHSGDMGRMDEDGYLYIVDRKKDMIIRGGFNVYPREIEEVLYGHHAVFEAAVVGVPSEQYGEEVKAYVALDEGAEVSPEEISAYCKIRLAGSKYPRIIEILDSLPKGSTGKILRKELRARDAGDKGKG